jgi:hypothetical protein
VAYFGGVVLHERAWRVLTDEKSNLAVVAFKQLPERGRWRRSADVSVWERDLQALESIAKEERSRPASASTEATHVEQPEGSYGSVLGHRGHCYKRT